MKNTVTRRSVLRASAALSASALLSPLARAVGGAHLAPSPIRLGIASYTFRKFDQAKLIEYMHELKTPYLNLKDVHLPMTPLDQVKVRADEYRAAGLKITAGGDDLFSQGRGRRHPAEVRVLQGGGDSDHCGVADAPDDRAS